MKVLLAVMLVWGMLAPCKRAGADNPAAPASPALQGAGRAFRVLWFGLEEAMNRAGREVPLTCRIEKAKHSPALSMSVTLYALPEGVKLVRGDKAAKVKLEQRLTEVRWLVRAERPLSGQAGITATCTGSRPESATATLDFTAPVPVKPGLREGKPWVPAPEPAKSDYEVGIYYFPGWRQGATAGWQPIMDYPERKPVLGWYQEGEPEIADWHIKWAVEHGVTFFAYDWYWDRGVRSLEHALHDGYLQASYRNKLKFCLLWANHNPEGSASEEDLLAVTRYWIDHYFRLSEYLKVDGKPVVIIFSPGRIQNDMGTALGAEGIAKMQALCREAGFAGLYLVGCAWKGRGQAADLKMMGFDALTGYNYPKAGAEQDPGLHVPYDSAPEGYRAVWEEILGYGYTPYLPVTDPGWDARPWAGERALVRTGKHPDKFKRMLEYAKAFADAHPLGEERRRLVLVEAWNEFGEGDFVEPAREFGFGYLDAIREVFAPGAGSHQDVIPQDVGLSVPQWQPVQVRTEWDFNTDGETQGWSKFMNVNDFAAKGGVLRAVTVGSDPALTVPVDLEAEEYPRLWIRMRLDKGTMAQLFWAGENGPESEDHSVRWETVPDGKFHEYTLDLAANPGWRGTINRLRLDPNSDHGAKVEIDAVKMLKK